MAKPDGGPAFPFQFDRAATSVEDFEGMSLRDYFAGQALIAIGSNDHVDGAGDPDRHAATAYRIADAMLAEREKD